MFISIPDSSATNKTGLLTSRSEIITSEILSLSSFFNNEVKSLILLFIFLLNSFLSFCLMPKLDILMHLSVYDIQSIGKDTEFFGPGSGYGQVQNSTKNQTPI